MSAEEKRKIALLRLRKLSQKYISPDITTDEIRRKTAAVAEESARKRADRIAQREAGRKKNTFTLPAIDTKSVRERLPSIKREDVERMKDRLQKLNGEDVRNMKLRLQEKANSSRVSTVLKSWASCGGFDTVCGVDDTPENDEASRFDLLEENIDSILREHEKDGHKEKDAEDDTSVRDMLVSSFDTKTTDSYDDDDQDSLDSLELAFMEISRGDTSAAPHSGMAMKKVRNYAQENGLSINDSDDYGFQAKWPDSL